jgi:hypothetical protein
LYNVPAKSGVPSALRDSISYAGMAAALSIQKILLVLLVLLDISP